MNDQTRPTVGTAIALPSDPMQLMALARELAMARLIPPHFQKSPADCWLVMSFCRNRNLDFMMVVGECSVVQGRLFFSGKLTAALLNTSGYLAGRLSYDYDYDDDGNARAVVVSGRLSNETAPRSVSVHLDQVKTANKVWTTQPEQQLAYAGARIWGRRHVPEVLMGLLFEGEQIIDVTPTVVEPPHDVAGKPPKAKPVSVLPLATTHDHPESTQGTHDATEQTSGDAYSLRWQGIMAEAQSAEALTMQWNAEKLVRGNLVWHDDEQFARLKEKVTRRIEELKKAQAESDDGSMK